MNRNQKNFLNAAGCFSGIKNGISNKKFWPSTIESAKRQSESVGHCKKSPRYREQLEPYLHKRVQIVSTKGWNVVERLGSRVRLCLNDAMLVFVCKQNAEKMRIPTGHIHIVVDANWMLFVNPQPNEDLLVNGVLYEYANAQGLRNIAILPVVVTPIKNHHKSYDKKRKPRRTEPSQK